MGKVQSILETTESIARARDEGSADQVHSDLIELRNKLRQLDTEDMQQASVLEVVKNAIKAVEEMRDEDQLDKPTDIPEELATQIRGVTQRVDALCLQSSYAETADRAATTGIAEERDLYRAKLVRSQRLVEQYQNALAEELSMSKETHDSVAEFIQGIEREASIDTADPADCQSHEEELEKASDELYKMRKRREEFRKNHDLDGD